MAPRQYFSPYRPRGPRSPRLTLIWIALFLFILYVVRWLSLKSGDRGTDKMMDEYLSGGKMERVEVKG
ncbi:hypothetical protein QBC38DRAFT_475111 [Podospora fimiseda]|uniref:Uncharacterized protein n=1 Tax=Podospora fimiseda TaxID=252190 RepID=A0AAN7BRV0_9PEZI|nr:hypothetical protein QBC38DRAFT_475111 [Podospora fimiseda]